MPVPQRQVLLPNGHPHTFQSRERREGPQKVFVYGTLKKGFPNHERCLKGAKDNGIARLEGLMFHLGAFPAINLSERFSTITGEVYEVDWDHIDSMDILEGVANNYYTRIEAPVKPHGMVWTYIFTHDKAEQQTFVIPSGWWRGPETPRVKWAGFGKGVEIGSFETRSVPSEIKIGPGTSDYILRRDETDTSYKLIHKPDGEVIGSYLHLRDMVSKDVTTKPVLRLPGVAREVLPAQNPVVVSEVKKNIYGVPADPRLPIIWTPETEAEVEIEEEIPQAAQFLGIKYGVA